MLRGGVDGLARRAEPGTERARMGAGLMVPMLELVGDNLRNRKSSLDKKHPRQRDDQMICEARVHKRKSVSHSMQYHVNGFAQAAGLSAMVL